MNKVGKLLFTLLPDHSAALPPRDGWYNITKAEIIGREHDENVTLNLQEVETCKIYSKAYFEFNAKHLSKFGGANFERCQEKGETTFFKGSANDYFLISTKTNGNKTRCSLEMKSRVEGTIVQQHSDQNATFVIIDEQCLGIESGNFSSEEWRIDDSKLKKRQMHLDAGCNVLTLPVIGAGGGVGVLILALAVFAVLRCRKEKAVKSGNREC